MTELEGRALYRRLLGSAWDQLHPQIRRAHSQESGVCLSGVFRVEVGTGPLAWFSRLVSGVPLKPREFPATLSIRPRDGAEVWERVIGPWTFSTLQWEHRGVLRERYGLLMFDLHPEAIDGGLRYTQTGLGLALGPIRVPVPNALAVRVTALEECAPHPLLTKLTVRVDLPFVGLLVAYGGALGRS